MKLETKDKKAIAYYQNRLNKYGHKSKVGEDDHGRHEKKIAGETYFARFTDVWEVHRIQNRDYSPIIGILKQK